MSEPDERDFCIHGLSAASDCGGCDALGQIEEPVTAELIRLRNRITALEANGSELLARGEQLAAENERLEKHVIDEYQRQIGYLADDVKRAEAERDALKAAIEQIEIAFIIKRDGIRQRDPNDHDRGAAQVMEIVENVFAATLVAPEAPGDADVQA